MEIIDCDQNSEEWIKAKLGVVSASNFGKVLASGKSGGESVTRKKYMLQLIAERLSGLPTENFSNGYTDRGHELEPETVAWYEAMHGVECEKVGFIRDGDKGCSPDRLVGDNGLVEAKSRKGELQLELLMSDKVPSVHIPQVQGQIWISQREWCDFISYSRGLPTFERRVYRDDKYINGTLWPGVDRFIDEMLTLMEKFK